MYIGVVTPLHPIFQNFLSGNTQIKYGGVDVDGSLDPAARYLDIWDDEEEEEDEY